MKQIMAPGTLVGAERWPGIGGHPDSWGTPHKGIVLEISCPTAWRDTLVFPLALFPAGPTRDLVKEEIRTANETLKSLGMSLVGQETVPVSWDFGKIMWEKATDLRSYRLDVEMWSNKRTKAYSFEMNQKSPKQVLEVKKQVPCTPCGNCQHRFMEKYNVGFDDGWCCSNCHHVRSDV